MNEMNLENNINWLLLRSSLTVKQKLIKVSDEYDLSLMQALTLCMLVPNKAVPMSSISDMLSCDPSNVTGIIERLSVGSYIDRRESRTDRRVKTIELTDEGIALRNELLPRIIDNEVRGLTNLTAAELAILTELLAKTLPSVK